MERDVDKKKDICRGGSPPNVPSILKTPTTIRALSSLSLLLSRSFLRSLASAQRPSVFSNSGGEVRQTAAEL